MRKKNIVILISINKYIEDGAVEFKTQTQVSFTLHYFRIWDILTNIFLSTQRYYINKGTILRGDLVNVM